MPAARALAAAALVLCAVLFVPCATRAQDEAAIPAPEDTTGQAARESYENHFAGEFTPARGFDIIKTERGSLNISVYGLFRWIDQLPADQTFTDHLGRTRVVKTRNDINWHRSFVWLSGFFYVPKFNYTISIWSLPTTQQTLVFGSLRYTVNRKLTLGVGIGPNLTCRSMQGTWPFWAGTDRQMAEEAVRGGFSSTFFITGEPISRVYYTAAVSNNLSQLGVTATNDTRDMGVSASIWTMPTTGEFGPRGGFGDLEHHTRLATRFGTSAEHSRESRYAANDLPPNATQIRLSDGVYPFEAGALAEGVIVEKLDYDQIAFDAGAKYRGFSIQGEYYIRRLSNFAATGPLPLDSILDHGFMLEAMHMVVPKHVGLYAACGYLFDDFERNPWEIAGGLSYYPYGKRAWRLNLHVIRVEKSPAGSNFGYYTAGQSGTTLSLATDILL